MAASPWIDRCGIAIGKGSKEENRRLLQSHSHQQEERRRTRAVIILQLCQMRSGEGIDNERAQKVSSRFRQGATPRQEKAPNPGTRRNLNQAPAEKKVNKTTQM